MAVAAQTTVENQIRRAEEEGWTYRGDMATEGEVLDLLYSLVRVTKPDVCVETGTYHGHGTLAIAEGLRLNERGNLWTVEVSEDYEYTPRDRVTYVQADSLEWSASDAPAGINFALVDCAEDPSHRVEVFRNLLPRMTSGSMICAHDVSFYRNEDYLEPLCEAAEAEPNILFPALNGIAIWVR